MFDAFLKAQVDGEAAAAELAATAEVLAEQQARRNCNVTVTCVMEQVLVTPEGL